MGFRLHPGCGLILLTLFLGSCSLGETPRQAAEGYLKALEALDFSLAGQYLAEEGQGSLTVLKTIYDSLSAEEQEKFRVSGWSITGVTEAGDTALVAFVFDEVKKGQISLRRLAGVWKVEHRSTF